VIPDGAVIESFAIPPTFTHIAAEEGTNSAHRFEQFPEQRGTVTGVDKGDHPFLVPLAKEAGCEKWFLDKIIGSKAERKGLDVS
jgi:hypothetical protein